MEWLYFLIKENNMSEEKQPGGIHTIPPGTKTDGTGFDVQPPTPEPPKPLDTQRPSTSKTSYSEQGEYVNFSDNKA
jgi:hypothetical protein